MSFGFMVSCSTEPTIDPKESFFDRLGTESIVKLQIESDLSELIENRDQKMTQEATLSVENSNGGFKAYPLKISLRGKTRRGLCEFPPLKLDLNKGFLEAEGLKDFDKYKLVTHCMDDSELVLKEFLAYKLYNQLTEYSFRVRLVELTYIDHGGEMETFEQYGILLENYEEMTERFAAEKMPDQLPKNTRIPNEDYQRLAMFQYMIGNTDWNLFKQHNIKWLQLDDAAIPVPYDFDFSGFVNAPYAKPHPSLPIDSVRERYLQWRGSDQTQLANMQDELRQKQADLIQTCQQFQALSDSEKAEILSYLNEFFSMEGPMVAAK
ncbi:MAG: hypothetical protein Sapg2KO_37400 [Saprospiraceae bacterium]